MNEVYLQLWEIVFNDGEIIPDGCTIHLSLTNRQEYVDKRLVKYKSMRKNPYSIERPVGIPADVSINNSLYNILLENKYIQLMEHEMNNLIEMGEIIINE